MKKLILISALLFSFNGWAESMEDCKVRAFSATTIEEFELNMELCQELDSEFKIKKYNEEPFYMWCDRDQRTKEDLPFTPVEWAVSLNKRNHYQYYISLEEDSFEVVVGREYFPEQLDDFLGRNNVLYLKEVIGLSPLSESYLNIQQKIKHYEDHIASLNKVTTPDAKFDISLVNVRVDHGEFAIGLGDLQIDRINLILTESVSVDTFQTIKFYHQCYLQQKTELDKKLETDKNKAITKLDALIAEKNRIRNEILTKRKF